VEIDGDYLLHTVLDHLGREEISLAFSFDGNFTVVFLEINDWISIDCNIFNMINITKILKIQIFHGDLCYFSMKWQSVPVYAYSKESSSRQKWLENVGQCRYQGSSEIWRDKMNINIIQLWSNKNVLMMR